MSSAMYLLNPAMRTQDISGNGYALTIASTVSDVAGPAGMASRGGRMTRNDPAFRTDGPLSLSTLINLDASGGDRWIAGCEKVGPNGQTWWKFGVLGTRALCYAYDHAGGHQDLIALPGVLPTSGWVTLAFARAADKRTISFSVNGFTAAVALASADPLGGSDSELFLMNDAYHLENHSIAQVFLTF